MATRGRHPLPPVEGDCGIPAKIPVWLIFLPRSRDRVSRLRRFREPLNKTPLPGSLVGVKAAGERPLRILGAPPWQARSVSAMPDGRGEHRPGPAVRPGAAGMPSCGRMFSTPRTQERVAPPQGCDCRRGRSPHFTAMRDRTSRPFGPAVADQAAAASSSDTTVASLPVIVWPV